MHWFRWAIGVRRSMRHAISVLLFATVLAALVPIPFFSSSSTKSKDRSQPFPCQDRPCGCLTAEQCRRKCCCFSKSQKLAWAKRNGVPTDTVVAINSDPLPPRWNDIAVPLKNRFGCDILPARNVDRESGSLVRVVSRSKTQRGCCSSKNIHTSKVQVVGVVDRLPKTQADATIRTKFVIGIMAQGCHGIDHAFAGLAAFVLPPIVSLNAPIKPRGDRIQLEGTRFSSRDNEPPVPPPRMAIAERAIFIVDQTPAKEIG